MKGAYTMFFKLTHKDGVVALATADDKKGAAAIEKAYTKIGSKVEKSTEKEYKKLAAKILS